VGASVIQERVAQAGLMMSGALASSAVKRSPVTGTTIPSVAPVRVVSAARTGHAEPVFDLTVDGAHEFFANDILVHNSSDLVVYGLREIAALFESGQVAQDEKPRSSADKMHAPTFVEPTISTLAPSDGESDLPPLPEWAEDDDW
jgi:hypothetical protein